jgi:hypothetical protein
MNYRKGQNVRFFIDGVVTAEETTLTITRGVDTENSQNKDLAADSSSGNIAGEIPVAMWKNMSFQVEAQGEGAKTLFTKALALMTADGGVVGWAQTSGTGNRTAGSGALQNVHAICNDLTITAPNRHPVTCSAQFMVVPGSTTTTGGSAAAITTDILRGEFLRLFIGTSTASKPIALATSASLHVSLSLEDATTKDETSSSGSSGLAYKAQAPTTLTYEITSDTLYGGNDTAQDIDALEEGATYKWKLADASSTHQWTAGTTLISGDAMLTSLSTNAPVAQNVTHSGTFTGKGVFDSASAQSDSPSLDPATPLGN